jgi:hypothetical protein
MTDGNGKMRRGRRGIPVVAHDAGVEVCWLRMIQKYYIRLDAALIFSFGLAASRAFNLCL